MLEYKFSDCKGDIGFLIDGSGSIVGGTGIPNTGIHEYRWNLIQDFILVLAKTIGISESGTRMAVVVFSFDAKLEIQFSDHQNYDSFEKAVLAINNPAASTNTLRGFEVALNEMFNESTGMRADQIPKNLIYLTDGQCASMAFDCRKEKFEEYGNRFRERKIRKIGIGIGGFINYEAESEIISFVGKQNFIKEDNFYTIMTEKFRTNLAICDGE